MGKQTIVVIDDEEDILELLKYNLGLDGFAVTCFTTGEEALSHVCKELPDLVIVDLMLPGMNGLEVVKQLKADLRTSAIPVVMLTARTEEADILAGLELGVTEYVTKPFSPRMLMARIKAMLKLEEKTR
jgi:two-component system, OmpR family, alkaline phosphatase synthesis response regulator PhoP